MCMRMIWITKERDNDKARTGLRKPLLQPTPFDDANFAQAGNRIDRHEEMPQR